MFENEDPRECQCEVLHVGPICTEFHDNDQGICITCEHEEACHEFPK